MVVVLAVASTAFAAHMMSKPDQAPHFAGLEHLSIFSRPARVASSHTRGNAVIVTARHNEIDYTPTGATTSQSKQTNARLAFTVLAATPDSALIRDSSGAVMRVMKGDFVSEIGRIDSIERQEGRWIVVTSNRTLVERADGEKLR